MLRTGDSGARLAVPGAWGHRERGPLPRCVGRETIGYPFVSARSAPSAGRVGRPRRAPSGAAPPGGSIPKAGTAARDGRARQMKGSSVGTHTDANLCGKSDPLLRGARGECRGVHSTSASERSRRRAGPSEAGRSEPHAGPAVTSAPAAPLPLAARSSTPASGGHDGRFGLRATSAGGRRRHVGFGPGKRGTLRFRVPRPAAATASRGPTPGAARRLPLC
jgi:hypothetical protein